MALVLDEGQIEEILPVLEKACNESIVGLFEDLAAGLKDERSDNPMIADIVEGCIKVQNNYNNGLLVALQDVLENFRATVDISQYLNKRDLGSNIQNVDTGVKVDRIDPSSVIV